MKRKKIDPTSIFLNDKDGLEMLKSMIIAKANRLDFLEDEFNEALNAEAYPEVTGDIRPYFLEKVAELSYGIEISQLEKELRNMCYTIGKAEHKFPQTSKWEASYEKATQDTKIEEVVRYFLGDLNFRRNLKCPFHQDKSPSLKIYTNRNKYVCFACGTRGSPIDFVMQYKNYDFKEAVEFINQM